MLFKIQFLIIICLLLISCRESIRYSSSDAALNDSLGAIHRRYGNSYKGMAAATSLFAARPRDDISLFLPYYNYLSSCYGDSANYPLQLKYADSALFIVAQSNTENLYSKEKALANINKAHALYYMRQYKGCYYYYCMGSIEAEKIHDSALTVNVYQHLSMFLYEEGNYAKAIYYYKQLLANTTDNNKTYERLVNNQGLLDNIGFSLLKEKKPDSAILYFRSAIQAIEEAEALRPAQTIFCRSAAGVVYGNIAQAYAMKRQYDSAEQLYKQSIAINSQPGYAIEDALITQQHLAKLYYEEQNIPAFHEVLISIKRGLDTIPNKSVELSWNNMMNQYYAAVKQPATALAYLTHYIQLRDSARSARRKGEPEIFDQMNLLQSKYEVNLLMKDNQMKQDYLWAAVTLIFLALIIAGLTFFLFWKSRKNIFLLTTLNTKINHKQILLEDTLLQLEKENREKQHILHVVAHDLRNPISAIHTLAIMTEDEYEDEDAVRENLALIKSACTNSAELISGILEIAENEEIKYACQPVDVNKWLSNITALLRMKAREKNQRISLMTSREKGVVYADIEKLNRVLTNIVTNAIKFSPAGSSIEISAVALEEHITIQVKDNGIGIPQKYHSSIFDAFTESRRPGTEGEKPFGLGLSISKQIIEKHHGSIWFESEEGEGTTFFIKLPRLKDILMPAADTTKLLSKPQPAVNPAL